MPIMESTKAESTTMTDGEMILWLVTKGTMEDKPVLHLVADRIKALTAERDRADRMRDVAVEAANLFVKKLADAETDNDRLRAEMRHIMTYVSEPSDLDGDTINALRADLRFVGRVARAALTGKEPDNAVS